FTDPATTELYTLSLHDALPIWKDRDRSLSRRCCQFRRAQVLRAQRHWIPIFAQWSLNPADHVRWRTRKRATARNRKCRSNRGNRSEEHTSELQSLTNLVCRLLL